ncbi:MAG: transposase domain-containing protein [Alcaligenes sp.]|uniref:transposase domain-containing protein n=1 Tax=Alcaligenes faecalis TaxID=511 RepID=UPI003CFE61EB
MQAIALIYSLVETAKASGREPYTWLRMALRELPLARTVDEYEELLPWNLHPETLALNTVGAEP